MKSLTIVLCLGCVFVSFAEIYSRRDWNKLILTHHWPETFCSMEHCKANFNYWTLHGFWPNIGNDCNSTWHFNASLIEDLMKEMKTFWPDLIKPASTTFWKHEWVKHGTCAAKAEALNSEHRYFSKALELYHKLDLDSVLKQNHIVPGKLYYKFADLEESISSFYGVTPKIQCVPDGKKGDFQTLGQIEICVDKQFQLVDCENAYRHDASYNQVLPFVTNSHSGYMPCDPAVPVYYPPSTSRQQGFL